MERRHTIVEALGPLVADPGHDPTNLGVHGHAFEINVGLELLAGSIKG